MKQLIIKTLILCAAINPVAANAQDWVRPVKSQPKSTPSPAAVDSTVQPPASRPIVLPVPGSERDCFYQGVVDGRRVARKVRLSGQGGDRVGGAVAGTVAFGAIGSAVALGSAAASSTMPPEDVLRELNELSLNYQQGFLSGYEQQYRQMGNEDAWFGVIIGAGLLALIGSLLLITSSR